MKKTMLLLLAVLLAFSLFAGCSSAGETAPAATPAPAATEAATEAATAAPEEPSAAEAEPAATAEETGGREGTLIVGLDDTFAPMGFRDEANELVGFDIDLANAVGEELGWEIVFQPIAWDAKEMEIAAKNIDCIWNGMSRTPEREEMWTLSQNYFNNRIIIMTAPDVEITDVAQLADYQIGVQAKSAALEVIMANEIYGTIAGNIQEYPTYDEVLLDMQAGRIQAMIVDDVLGQYKNANLETKLNIATVDFGGDLFCIGFRKEDVELCKQVEDAIKAVAASGKGAEISEKWFGADLLLDMQ